MESDSSLEQVIEAVGAYLKVLKEIRSISRFRRIRDAVLRIVGSVAGGTVVAASAVCVIGGIAAMRFGSAGVVAWWLGHLGPWGAALFWIPVIPLIAPTVASLLRSDFYFRQDSRGPIVLWMLFLLVTRNISGTESWICFPWSIWGLFTGLALDSMRRLGTLASLRIGARRGLLYTPDEEYHIWADQIGPTRTQCPVLPFPEHAVFISYSRTSPWCNSVATRLHELLEHGDCKPLIDRVFIAHGGNWHRDLQESLSRAEVFVSIADETSVIKEWPARELETALAANRRSGIPQIVVLVQSVEQDRPRE